MSTRQETNGVQDCMIEDPTVDAGVKTAQEREDYERMLSHLDPDPSLAWDKYGEIRRMLAKYFECNHCSDPNELANESLSRVAKKLRTEPILNICGYARRVAHFVRLEDLRDREREVAIDENSGGPDALIDEADPEQRIVDKIDHEVSLTCLRECLAKLNEADRKLVVGYYSADEGMKIQLRRTLAQGAGISMGALWTHMNRLRTRLERCFRDSLANHHAKIRAAWGRTHPSQF